MKKCFLLLVMSVSSVIALAQSGAYLSLGATKFNEKVSGTKFNHKQTPSFEFGFIFGIPIDARFSVNTGLGYGNSGTRYVDNSGEKNVVTLGYVSVPVEVMYKFSPEKNSFFLTAGGYYSFLTTAEDKHAELKIADGVYSYKRSDYGVGLGAGYVFPGKTDWFLKADYTKGLANILNYPDGDEDSHIKNTNVSVTIGWLFFKKKI
jgi:hypothetical protein